MNPEVLLSRIRVVLCRPSHPGNIGAAARAMKTMGLSNLYLVAPKQFPDPEADTRATGAVDVLAQATVTTSLKEALAGDILRMDSGVLEASERKLTFFHRLTQVETEQVVMTSKVFTVNMDLDARRSTLLDPAVLRRARARLLPQDTL